MTEEQRKAKEPSTDIHLNIPQNLLDAVDKEKKEGESRKDCIVRLLRVQLSEQEHD